MSKRIILSASVLAIVLLALTPRVYATDLKAGEQVFTANCSACHAGGNNAIMPEKTLKKDDLDKNGMNSFQAITTQVTNGKNAMPAFGGRLAEEDIQNVAHYVLSQSERGWQ